MADIHRVLDLFGQRTSERADGIRAFLDGTSERRFLVVQRPPSTIWSACNSVEQVCASNLAYLERALECDHTDELPYLEPWVGVGVYASAFGCEYLWRDDNAPDTHYRYHDLEELRSVEYPDMRKSPIMKMVLDCIDALKEQTHGRIPIALTDTQSPFDTATLVLDASELFVGCYSEPELVQHFLSLITRLIVEFSEEQTRRIGESLVARPGHIMVSLPGYRGISISDDNLAVSSPKINERIALPFDQMLGEAFGGVAIHSCGPWAQTMARLTACPSAFMLDCALSQACDPNPNDPAHVRDALKGQDVIAKVRFSSDTAEIRRGLEALFDPSLRLIVEIGYDEQRAEACYKETVSVLEELYEGRGTRAQS
jgi:hypothetical protein